MVIEFGSGAGRRNVVANIEQACEHALHIGVDGWFGDIESETGDGACGVGTDTGEGTDGGGVGGEVASVLAEDFLGGAMKISGA